MKQKSNKYRCWHNSNGDYDLAFDDNILSVKIKMPCFFKNITIIDENNQQVYNKLYVSTECKCKLNLSQGKYYLSLYCSKNGIEYEAYIGGKQIAIEFKDGEWFFLLPEYSKWNYDLINNEQLDYVLCETVLNNARTLKKVAARVTSNCSSEKEKILAIHDFVAKNLYYDYDSLTTNINRYKTIEQIAKDKRCVCQGYADLTLVLLASIGIDAENILCYAVDNIFERGWSDVNHRTSRLNHVITRARLENRWLYMDVTWDTTNRFEKGEYIKGKDVSHRYFDVTIPFLSATHRFFKKK